MWPGHFLAYNIWTKSGEEELMETILWALDLFAVVYLCYWGLKQDGGV